nr:hypothetical protein [Pectobacterium carotovorum]
MKYVIPRKLYPVPAQAKVGHRVIAREDIPRCTKAHWHRVFRVACRRNSD